MENSYSPDHSVLDASTEGAVEIRGVTVQHGEVSAVLDASVVVKKRECLSLLGPSGSGKSSLLHAIAGVVSPLCGTIVINGITVFDGDQKVAMEQRGVGLVFQEHALFPHLSVAANVAFGLTRGRRRIRPEHRHVVDEMLSLVRLERFGERFPHELSGGERQRVAIARALAPKPNVLLLDEPFASLDRSLAEELRTDLSEVLSTQGVASILVTHDPGDALALADRVSVMSAGRIVQTGTPTEVIRNPVDRVTAELLGPVTVLRSDQALRFGLGMPTVLNWPIEGAVVAVRTSDLMVDWIATEHSSLNQTGLPMRCTARTALAGYSRLQLWHQDIGNIVVDHPDLFEKVNIGDSVGLRWQS